jgi:hypothetical protein
MTDSAHKIIRPLYSPNGRLLEPYIDVPVEPEQGDFIDSLLYGHHLKHLLAGAAGRDGGQHGGLIMTPRLLIPGHCRLRHLLTGVAGLGRGRRGNSLVAPQRFPRGQRLRHRRGPEAQNRGRDGSSMSALLLLPPSHHHHYHHQFLQATALNTGSCWPPG